MFYSTEQERTVIKPRAMFSNPHTEHSTTISNGKHPFLYIYMLPVRLRDFVNTYFFLKHACLLLTLKVKTVTYTEFVRNEISSL